MYYGLYLSASGVLVNTHNQDVFANNLANVNTVGFKPMVPGVRQRPPESVEDIVPFGTEHQLLDRLGGGVLAAPLGTGFKASPPQSTGRDLDAALTDPNTFFAVRYTDPDSGESSVRLTRNGRFMIDNAGQLVTSAGHPVLDPNDQPITVDPDAGPARVDQLGRIVQGDEPVGQIQVARVDQAPRTLKPAGDNLFAFLGEDNRQLAESFGLLPQHTESSGASAIQTLMQVVASTKAANGNASMIRYQDTMIDRAVNTLGRVA